VYAVREDTGRRVLVEIQCDRCDAKTEPGDVDGWTSYGQDRGPGTEKLQWETCPNCQMLAEV
jgi:hypothetical protein